MLQVDSQPSAWWANGYWECDE